MIIMSQMFLFLFLIPDEKIPISYFHVPGCVCYSLVADLGCIYQNLEGLKEKYRVSCVMDSRFYIWKNQTQIYNQVIIRLYVI